MAKKTNEYSFKGWDFFKFAKGRKKLVVAGFGYLLGLFIGDSHVVATVSAAAVEMVFALCEYYIQK